MAEPYNATYVVYDGIYFNSSLLKEFNYTIYSNGTLSNASHCYLCFGVYRPYFLSNGTVRNGTACESPINPIEVRGAVGIAVGALFALLIMLGLSCLKKHGSSHLPVDRNFRLVSRRWQWYWLVVTAACGVISGLTAVDVDRDYVQGTAIVLQNFFYYLLLPTALASIWEMTRHWGMFCERQIVDPDPWHFKDEDRRSKIEFYLPLIFYLWAFLTFFLANLRTWSAFEKWQDTGTTITEKNATDPRFQASSIFALIAFFVIIGSFTCTIHYYKPVSRHIPPKIPLCLVFVFVRIGYNIACAWDFDISPLKDSSSPAYYYALGYLPILLVLIVMVIEGFREPNDDITIIKQRRQRDLENDRMLGIDRKRDKTDALPMKNFASDAPSTMSGSTLPV